RPVVADNFVHYVRLWLWMRRRWVLAALCLVLLFCTVRWLRLARVPDIGEPFDVAAFLAEGGGPGAQNAYGFYDQIPKRIQLSRLNPDRNQSWNDLCDFLVNANCRSWTDLPESVRAQVAEHHELIELFMRGSQVNRGQAFSPAKGNWHTVLPFATEF